MTDSTFGSKTYLNTHEAQNTPLSNEFDLLKQTEIRFGTVKHTSIARYFRETKNKEHQQLWRRMSRATPSSMAGTVEDGVAMVRKGSYALVIDSVLADYYASQAPCDLVQVPTTLPRSGYGIVLPGNSHLKKATDNVILKLQEAQTILQLRKKWFTDVCLQHEERVKLEPEVGTTVSLDSHSEAPGPQPVVVRQYACVVAFFLFGLFISIIVHLLQRKVQRERKVRT